MFKRHFFGKLLIVALLVTALAGCSANAQPRPNDGTPGEAPSTGEPETVTIEVYFAKNGDKLVAVEREIEADKDSLEEALLALLAGPTEEEQTSGLHSWFSEETEGMLTSVEVTEDGTAIINFEDFSQIIPGASSSAGSEELLGMIKNTVFQFEEVKAIDLRFDDDSSNFWNWLQRESTLIERAE